LRNASRFICSFISEYFLNTFASPCRRSSVTHSSATPPAHSTQAPLPGNGPGGGAAATSSTQGGGGTFGGNTFLISLVGGSGGGGGFTGGSSYFDNGGGAGGDALLIASSTQITVGGAGAINAFGGAGAAPNSTYAGCGAGGAIRPVSTTIIGTGPLRAAGGGDNCAIGGGAGVIRLEAYNNTYSGGTSGTVAFSSPFPFCCRRPVRRRRRCLRLTARRSAQILPRFQTSRSTLHCPSPW
jgi:hypothetical protein